MSVRHEDQQSRYDGNITEAFPEDDNLFIHELIAVFPLLTTGMISSAPPPKAEARKAVHSSRDSGGFPDVYVRCRATVRRYRRLVRQPSTFGTDHTKLDPR